MGIRNFAIGFVVGVVGGVSLSVLNAPQSGRELTASLKSNSGTVSASASQVKEEINNIKQSVLRAKHEASNIKELTNEVKDLVDNFKTDIEPNIDHLKDDVATLQNTAEDLQHAFDKPNNK